jgi:hypothetical protein
MKYISGFNSFLNEGRARYDSLTRSIVKESIKQWVKDWKKGKSFSTYEVYIEQSDLVFDCTCTLYFDKHPTYGKVEGIFQSFDTTGADSNAVDDEGDDQDPYIIIEVGVDSDELPGYWSHIYMHISDIVRHEIEHITQGGEEAGNYRLGKPNDHEADMAMRAMIKQGLVPKHYYLLLPKEVDANIQGLRYQAKKEKVAMIVAVDRYLDTQTYLTPKTREEVMSVWRKRAAEIGGIPKF